jgi:hypothetical protein
VYSPKKLLLVQNTYLHTIDGVEGEKHLQRWKIVYFLCELKKSQSGVTINIHNLGLGTKHVFLHVGWVQNLNLFLVVLILVSTRATLDSGTKY